MENMAKKGGIYLDSNFLDQGNASDGLYSKINQTGTHMVGVGSYKVIEIVCFNDVGERNG